MTIGSPLRRGRWAYLPDGGSPPEPILGCELRDNSDPAAKVFNEAAFTTPPTGQQGNFGRNVLRGFDANQADVGLQSSSP